MNAHADTSPRPHLAPLVPVALAVTGGILLDRWLSVPLEIAGLVLLAAVIGWMSGSARSHRLAIRWMVLGFLAVGAAHHHAYLHVHPANDIGTRANRTPQLVRIRGSLAETPRVVVRRADPLSTQPAGVSSLGLLDASALLLHDGWQSVSGRVGLTVAGRLDHWRAGDEIEALGWLATPTPAANPGERDLAAALVDRRIRAELQIRDEPAPIVRRSVGGWWRFDAWLAWLRDEAKRALTNRIDESRLGLASALLLGDGSALERDDWQRYVRTGVVHVLVVSGQHLMALALVLSVLLGLLGVRRARAAIVVALVLCLYALLTGGRPPALRAAVMVTAACGAVWLRRPVLPINLLALAWLAVLVVNPTDLATAGCQLSFLAVIVLAWGIPRWPWQPSDDDLERLLARTRPAWQEYGLAVCGRIAEAYGVTALVVLAVTPLTITWFGMATPAALVIGPPVALLASVAVITGLVQLCAELPAMLLGGWIVAPWAWLTNLALAGCDGLVRAADAAPGSHLVTGTLLGWWAGGAIGLILATLLLPRPTAWAWWPGPVGLGWAALGAWLALAPTATGDLRVTVLAVGHGGCYVLRLPDGRVVLYDTGSLAGPGVVRRIVAPYLWHEGVRRIDEVILSHADLDHFNGVPALLERFAIGRVTTTPSFSDKQSPGVELVLARLERAGVPMRIVSQGDRLTAGAVSLEVLHPPADGPDGTENARSLVLELRHGPHTMLLTGDLEGPGLAALLAQPPRPVDVLMAPHHGSPAANVPALAEWARPRLVIASTGPVRRLNRVPDPYQDRGAVVISTSEHGAIHLRSSAGQLTATTFVTRHQWQVTP